MSQMPHINVPGFNPVKIYDVPGIVLQQVLDNQVTARGLHNVLFNPDALSPSERTSFADNMVAHAGGESHPLIRTAMHVALNPLVWLMFLAAGRGAGAKAMAAGRPITEFKMGAGTWAAKSLPWAKQAFLTVNQVFADSPITDFLLHGSNARNKAYEEGTLPVIKAGGDFLQSLRKANPKLRLHSLDPGEYKKGSAEHVLVKDLANIEFALADGWEGGSIPVPTIKQRYWASSHKGGGEYGPWEEIKGEVTGEGGLAGARRRYEGLEQDIKEEMRQDPLREHSSKKVKKTTEFYEKWDERRRLISTADIDRKVAEMDQMTGGKFTQYFVAKQKAYRDGLVKLMYDEKEWKKNGVMQLDMDKVESLYWRVTSESMQDKAFRPGQNDFFQGREAIAALFDPTIADEIMEGDLTLDNWKDMVRATAKTWEKANKWYMPRNTAAVVPIAGVKLTPSMQEMLQKNPLAFRATNRVAPLTSQHVDPMFLPEDYDSMADTFFRHLKDNPKTSKLYEEKVQPFQAQRRRVQKWAEEGALTENARVPTVLTVDPHKAFDKYMQDYSETLGFALTKPTESMLKYAERFNDHMVKNAPKDVQMSWRLVKAGRSPTPGQKGIPSTIAQWLDYYHDQLNNVNPEAATYMRKVAIPAALGRNDEKQTALLSSFMFTKGALSKMASGVIGQGLRSFGGELGNHLVDRMEVLAQAETPQDLGGGFSGSLAKWFYLTHQGLNFGSVVINGMQPLLGTAPMLGVNKMIRGYADAVGDFGKFTKARIDKYGIKPITSAQRLELIQKEVPHWELLGLGENTWQMFDEVTFKQTQPKVMSWLDYAADMSMKGFETSEVLNRLSAYHAVRHTYLEAGKTVSLEAGSEFLRDAQKFVLGTQYGQHPLNTPGIFRSGILSNPLLRQYMTFPTRAAVDAFYAGPKMGGRDYWEGAAQHWLTGLGLSAVVYEVGKNMIGADLSRGLFASSALDLVGGEKLMDGGQEWIPLPPIAAIPTEFISGFAKDDVRMMSDAVARLVPGGVALNRTLGIMPDVSGTPAAIFGPLQKTYAGWSTPAPDGKVPVFKGDGNLIDFRSPSELVMRGLGVDLGKFSDSGQLDNFLLKNREEIIRYRQQYLAKLVANDYRGAQGVQAQFQKRFKMPLTVTKQQISAFVTNREAPRTERILNRIPLEGRGQYQQMVARGPYHLGIPKQEFLQNPTVASRDREHPGLTKNQLQAMVDRAMSQNQSPGGGAFDPFSPP